MDEGENFYEGLCFMQKPGMIPRQQEESLTKCASSLLIRSRYRCHIRKNHSMLCTYTRVQNASQAIIKNDVGEKQ